MIVGEEFQWEERRQRRNRLAQKHLLEFTIHIIRCCAGRTRTRIRRRCTSG